ncbi:unnamed protein product [Heterotrigona itama]|uniref:Uncharacterized protein n=1 Tax=Heterotrigona itama TaxID=395501 RepID=A0A6V7HB67_9HYME|nr:unnamed protein product [Heterotrigona itama]
MTVDNGRYCHSSTSDTSLERETRVIMQCRGEEAKRKIKRLHGIEGSFAGSSGSKLNCPNQFLSKFTSSRNKLRDNKCKFHRTTLNNTKDNDVTKLPATLASCVVLSKDRLSSLVRIGDAEISPRPSSSPTPSREARDGAQPNRAQRSEPNGPRNRRLKQITRTPERRKNPCE